MDLTYPPEAEAYREKIRAFLAEKLPGGWAGRGALRAAERAAFDAEWDRALRDAGFKGITWPREYGGAGLSPLETVVLAEEFAAAGVRLTGPNDVFGITMVGPTLMQWGTPEQKAEFLPKILSGEHRWCQGYSEPAAGSDLGNLGCRAVRDGDEWVVTGQKVWTSNGHLANWIFTLVRSDPNAPKHKGISFVLVPMDQPGVAVRPLRMLTGESHFNEVFFDDARAQVAHTVGGAHNGWKVAMTLLGHERGGDAATRYIDFWHEFDRLRALAERAGRITDPLVRQRLAWCYTRTRILRYLGLRALTEHLAGRSPGPGAAAMKLAWSEYHKVATELAMDLLGPAGITASGERAASPFGPDEPGSEGTPAEWADVFLSARAGTIYAGTSQVQRNILGEQVLGLPREPRADEGPWNRQTRV